MQASKFIGPGLLIAIKTIAMPLITEEIVSQLNVGANQTETSDLSDFGKYLKSRLCKFLYFKKANFHQFQVFFMERFQQLQVYLCILQNII